MSVKNRSCIYADYCFYEAWKQTKKDQVETMEFQLKASLPGRFSTGTFPDVLLTNDPLPHKHSGSSTENFQTD